MLCALSESPLSHHFAAIRHLSRKSPSAVTMRMAAVGYGERERGMAIQDCQDRLGAKVLSADQFQPVSLSLSPLRRKMRTTS